MFSSYIALMALTTAAAITSVPVLANPTGGTISAGNASITTAGTTLTITQTSQSAIIDWRGFNISQGETTNFEQPSSGSITLNRVNSPSPSLINGALTANGNIVIVNQYGVFFGKNATVNVNSLVVTSADIENQQFMAGNYNFSKAGNPNATIQNQGLITARQAGLVGLVAPNVLNSGIINVKLGTIHMASGDSFTVDLYGDNLMSIKASPALQSQLVQNTGKLNANGGTIAMTAAAAGETVNSLIEVGGTLNANAVGTKDGSIYIYAEGSNAVQNNVAADKGAKTGTTMVVVSGALTTTSQTGTGGTVDLLGDVVSLSTTAVVDAGGGIGGGTINIGGQQHGAGTTPTALTTTIEAGAVIKADATQNGNGGNVTIWSDRTTTFNGVIMAQGGPDGGNGGFIETSSHGVLSLTGSVQATAEKGIAGTWLLDPSDVTIVSGSGSDTGESVASGSWTPSSGAAASTIYVANINSALSGGTSVIINTTNTGTAGSGTGSITLSSGANISTTNAAALTFNATNNLVINGNISMGTGTLTLTGGGTGSLTGSGAISSSGAMVFSPGSSTSSLLSGVISGTGTVTMSGTGTLALAATNSYSGGTTVSAGTLTSTNSSGLGTGTINIGAAGTVSLATANNSNFSLDNTLTGTGILTVAADAGIDSFLFYGNNTAFAGTINAGTASSQNIRLMTLNGAAGNAAWNVVGTLDAFATGTYALGALTGTGQMGANGGSNITFQVGGLNTSTTYSGTIVDVCSLCNGTNVALTKVGTGTLTLSGTNSYSQGTTISAGTIATSNSSGLGSGSVSIGASGTLSISATSNLTIGNTVTGSGTLTLASVAGSTSLTLSSNITAFAGTVNAGTAASQNIRLSTANGSSANAAWTVVGILSGEAAGTYALGSLSGTGSLSANGSGNTAVFQVGGLNATTTFSGVIANAASGTSGGTTALTTVGSGTLTLTGTNTYSGGTTVSAGTLAASSASAFGTGSIDVQSAGTLSLSAPSSSWTFSNVLTADAGGNGSVNLQSVAGGTTSITISGNITAFAGTINAGTATDQEIKLSTATSSSANAVWNVTGVVMGESAVTYSLGAVTGSGGLAGDSGGSNIVTFQIGGLNTTTTYSGRIGKTASGIGSGYTALTKVGSGTLILTGTSTYSSTTTVTSGTLQIGNGGTSGAITSTSGVTDNANLVINRSDTSSLTLSSLLTSSVSGTGNFSATTGGAFTIDKTISLTGASSTLTIDAAGALTVSSALSNSGSSGVTILAAGYATAAGTSTGGDVTLNAAVTVASAATVDVFSGNPNTSTLDGEISGASGSVKYKTYDAAYTALTGAVSGTRNYFYRKQPTATVSGITASNKVYDSTTTATVNYGSATVSGTDGDSLTVTGASGSFASANVGTGISVTVSGITATSSNSAWSVSGYAFSGSTTANITTKTLTVTGETAANKTYDSTVTATLSGGSLSGVAGSDSITLTQAGSFSTAHAANNLTVTASDSISGSASGNYTLTQPTGLTANITAEAITVTAQANTKTYDGTTSSAITPLVTTGTLYALNTATPVQTYASAAAGTGLTLTPTLSGLTNATDYNITYVNNTAGVINQKTLTVTGQTAAGKTYDGTQTVTLSGGTLVGVVSGDTVNLATAGSFSSPNAGSNVSVTMNDSITGSSAPNYSLTQPTLSATISQKTLTVTGETASNKTYDGTTTVTLSGGSLVGVVSGDTVVLNDAGVFSSAHAATGISITVNDTLTGSSAPNYALTQPTLTANIIAEAITVTAQANTKTYDTTNSSSTAPTVTTGALYALNGSGTLAETYASPSAGTGLTLTPTLTGLSNASDYSITYVNNTAGVINQKVLTVTGQTAASKTYDSTVTATLSGGSLVGVYGSDSSNVTLVQAGSFTSAHAANGISVTAADTLTGSAALNYSVTQPLGITANIIAESITVTAQSNTKTYDGTTTSATVPTVTTGTLYALNGATLTQTYASANAGTNLTLTPSLPGLSNATDYNITYVNSTAGVINQKTLTVTGETVTTRIYDSTTTATLTGGSLVGVVSGDTVNLTESGSFSSPHAGTGISVTAADSISGASYANYTLTQPTLTGTITAESITVTAQSNTKTYDGGTSAATAPTVTTGTLYALNNATPIEYYSTYNAGSGLTLTPTLSGLTQPGDYNITYVNNTAGVINQKTVTVTGETAANKTYDSTQTAALSGGSLVGVLAGDSGNVSLTQAGSFSSSHAGTGIAITVSDSISGSAAPNYALTQPASVTGTITAEPITVTAQPNSKTYDATTSATAVPTVTTGTLYASNTGTLAETYSSANVGTGLTLIPTLTGLGTATDYTITYANNTAGAIIAKTLTVTGETANNKTYDGTPAAVLSGGSLVGVVSGDTVNLTQAGIFSSSNAGTGISITVSDSITGAASGNYTLTQPGALTANITQKALTVTGETTANKTYDSTTTAALSGGALVGVLAGDSNNVTLTQAGAFSSPHAANGISITVSDSITGSASGNYSLTQPTTTTANITPEAITVTALVNSKTYDGGTSASATPSVTTGTLYALNTATPTETYGTANVGTGLTLTPTLSGISNASDYNITYVTNTAGVITQKTLTVSGQSAANKTYDGTNTATLSGGSLSGLVAADVGNVTLTQAGSFSSTSVANGISITVADSISGTGYQNYALTQPTLTANITQKTLTVTGETASSKTYDGTTTATLSGGSLSGVIAGDTVNLTQAGSFSQSGVGTGISVTAADTITGSASGNYTVSQPAGLSANITQKTLTVVGETASNKTYDGTQTATLSGGSLSGLISGDTVNLTEAGSFSQSGVGTGISVTAADTISGGAFANYTLTQPSGLTANITAKALTVTGETAANKTYDSTTTATLSGGSLSGVIAGDTVTLTEAGSFSSAHAATGITVTPSDTLGGAAAGNYSLTQTSGLTANITAESITVTAQVNSKTYDGTTTSATAPLVTAGTLYALNGGTLAEHYSSTNVGTALTLTPTLTGLTNATDYSITYVTNTAGAIIAKALTVTGETAANKTYDGTQTATLSNGSLSGVVGSDSVTLTEAGNFNQAGVGTGIAITANDSISGSASGNYTLTQPGGLTANITAKTLTVSGETAANKIYDSSTAATLSGGTLVGVVSGDTVTLNDSGVFTSAHAASGISITVNDTLTGGSAGNYTLTQPSLTANITAEPITVTAQANSKTYDGGTSASTTPTVTGTLYALNTATPIETYASANAGTGLTLTPTLSGLTHASDYAITYVNNTAGAISQLALTVTGETATSKTYDSTVSAVLSGGSLVGVLAGESGNVSLVQAGSFSSAHAANGISITVADTLTGSASGNYSVTQPASLTGNITAEPITVTAQVNSKTYDGSTSSATAPTVTTGTLYALNGGTLAQTYASANVGTGLTLTPTLTGLSNATDYTITYVNNTAGVILAKTLTVTGETANNKTYDGTPAAVLSGGSLVGVVSGDTVNLTQAGSFASSNAGTGISITVADTITGAAAGNYSLTQPGTLTANITQKALTVTGETATSKTYDSTTTAVLTGGSLSGLLAGDIGNVSLTDAGSFASPHAGTGISVTTTDTITGSAAGNYSLTQPVGLTANITAESITVTAQANSKTYDGTTSSATTPTVTSGTLYALNTATLTQTYASASAGSNLTLTPTLSGLTSASDYSITYVNNTAGVITAKTLTVSGETAANKTYDSTATAVLSGGSLSGVIGGDNVSLVESGSFASPHVGTGIAVTAADTLTGGASGNYTLTQQTGLTANITAESITVTAQVNSKTYDGTTSSATAPTVTTGTLYALNTATLTQTYASSNAGTGLTLTPTLSGLTHASDYNITYVNNTAGAISQLALTVTGETASNKTYDSTTAAVLSGGVLVGVLPADSSTVNLVQAGSFSSAHAANGISITVTDTLTGSASNNYSVTQPATMTANITPEPITVTAQANTKTYDQTTSSATAPTVTTGSLYALNGGTLTQTYSSPNAGTGLTLAPTLSGLSNATDYTITYVNNTAGVINQKALTVTGETAASKTYDGTNTATLSGGSLVGVLAGDTVALTEAGTFSQTGAGNGLAVTAADTISGSSYSNYSLTQPATMTANITQKTLTVANETANNKVYDGTVTATLTGGNLVGVIAGDTVTLTQAGSFSQSNVGNNLVVTATDSLSGAAAGNYTLTQPSGLTANITSRTAVVVLSETAANKVYDGTATATLSGGVLSGVLPADSGNVTLTQAGSFSQSAVGTNIAVTATDSLSGSAAGNYTLTEPSGLTANITQKSLTVTGQTAANKVYDATQTAVLSGGSLTGVVAGDTVNLTQAGSFSQSAVGNGLTVTASDSISGAASGNYALTQPAALTANITQKTLTVSGETAANKVYDGTQTAVLSGGGLVGVVSGDTVNLTQAGSFSQSAVGNGLTVTPSDSITGAASGNYALTQPAALTANITQKTLTVSGETAANKVYDSTSTATLSGGTLVGVVAGDTVTLTQAGSFSQSTVGTGLVVTASDGINGAAAGNYSLTQPQGLTANITQKALTVSSETAANKVYDGTQTAVLSGGSLVGVVAGDTVTLTQAGSFSQSSVGTGLTVTASDSIGGAASSNYSLTQPGSLTANITQKTLTVSGETAANKTYDGTQTAVLSGGSLSGVIGSDTVNLTQAGNFSQSAVGTGLTITATDSITGSASGNYSLTQPLGLTANITAKTLTVSGETASNKVYDGTSAAVLSGGSLVGVVSGDTVNLTQSGSFSQSSIGTGLTVTMGDSISGAASGNYSLTQPASLTANITQKALTVTGETAANKTYDSTTTALLSGGSLSGLVAGDVGAVSLTQAGSFSSPHAGNGIAITVNDSISGSASGNYSLTQPTTLTATISAEPITVTAQVNSKIYDGTSGSAAAPTVTAGTLYALNGGTLAQTYASANAGTGLTLTPTLSGLSNPTDYSISYVTNTAGVITAKTLTVSGETANNKTYDGTPTAVLSGGSLTGVIAGDTVNLTQAGSFATSNAGTGISITVADTITGSAAGNYSLTQPGTLTANITQKPLTVSGETATSKTYDSTVTAVLTGGSLSGLISGDSGNVSLTEAGSFASPHVGTGISVTATDSITGSASNNYSLTQPTGLTANITVESITVTAQANSKTYDGTALSATAPTVTTGTLYALNGGTLAQTYASPNAGTNLTLTPTLSGLSNASDYHITYVTNTAGVISQLALTVSGETANNKTYDSTNTAVLSGGTLVGVLNGDSSAVSLVEAGSFATPHVGNGIAVTAADTLSGSASGNYSLTQTPGLTASITPESITVTAQVNSKTYDGTSSSSTAPLVTTGTLYALNTATPTQTYASPNAGTGLTLTPTLSGLTSASDYSITYVNNTAGVINQKTLVVLGETASNKTYDGTQTATLNHGTLSGVVGTDTVTLTEAGNFATANVGTGIAITAVDSISGAAALNYTLTQPLGLTATITAKSLTVIGETASNKTYDQTTTATLSGGSLSGVVGTDTVTLTEAGSFATANAGNGIAVTAADTLGGSASGNYTLAQPAGLTANITPKVLTVNFETASNKTYDGTPTATLVGGSLAGVINGDTVTLTEAGSFSQSGVGTGLAVTATDSLAGASAGNYSLTQPLGLTATITAKALTVNGETANNKTYDTTTTATLSGGSLVGVVAGDNVSLVQAGSFASPHAAVGIAVTAADTIGGSDSANYTLTQPSGLTATITAEPITVTAQVNSKTYDGGMTASAIPIVTTGTLYALNGGTLAETYTSQNVGTNLTLTPTLTGLSNATDYAVTTVNNTAGVITQKALTVTGETANNKTYDGTPAAVLSGGSLVGVVGSDNVTLTQAGSFATSNAGTGITITVADGLAGGAAGNYSLTQPATLTANIIPLALTVNHETANNKVYDSTTTAVLSGGSLVGVLPVDTNNVTLSEAGSFASPHAGAGIAVTAADSVTGSAAGNYTVTQPTGLSASITAEPITVTAQASSKSYDGGTSSSLAPQVTTGTLYALNGGTLVETYGSANAGTGLTLTPSVTGLANATDYNITYVNNTTGVIIAKALTVTGETVTTKSYDGTPTATLSGGSLQGLVGSDSVTLTQAGSFTSSNAGTGIAVTVADSISGSASGNYTVTQPTLTGTITPKALTVSGETANNKSYDGTTAAVLSGGSLQGILPIDTGNLSLNEVGNFASSNAGTNIAVTAADSLTGSAAGNYTVTQPLGLSATIAQKALTVFGEVAANKTYDGTTAATLSGGVLSGVIPADQNNVSLTEAGVFASPHAGSNITVNAADSLSGTAAGNYALTQPAALTANITPESITVTAQAASKTYDGSTGSPTAAQVTSGTLYALNGGSLTETYASANAGTGLTLTPTLSGLSYASDYNITYVTSTAGVINPKSVNVIGQTANDKTYDGTTTVTLSGGSLSGVIGGDSVYLTTAGSFASPNAGTNVAVFASDGLGGGAAGNYTLNEPTLSATIFQKRLTVTGETANNKIYDSTTAAVLTGGSLVGVVAGDTGNVTLSEGGSFATANAGTGIVVSAIDTLSGSAAGNYKLTQPLGLTANITAEPITVTAQANSKIYDGTTNATAAPLVTAGTLYGANSLTLAETYVSANAGTALTLIPTLTGLTAPANYSIIYVNSTAGVISPKPLTVTGETASNKTYDGTTTATLGGGSLSGVLAGDVGNVTLAQAGNFTSSNAGTGIAITVADSLSGSASGNYTVTQPLGLSASISQKALTVLGESASNKTYDGTTTATLSGGSLSGLVARDTGNVTLTDAGSFTTANAGANIAVTTADSLSGSAAGNYTLIQPTLSATITPKALTVTGETASSKTYDSTTTATLSGGSLSGVVAGDAGNVSLTEAGSFASPHVGTGIAITTADSLSGSAAGNYTVTQTLGLSANITPEAITVTAQPSSKVYDGTINSFTAPLVTNGTLYAANGGKLAETYSSADIGTGLTLTPTLTGLTHAGDYTITFVTNNAGSIVQFPGTVSVVSQNPILPFASDNLSGVGATNSTLSWASFTLFADNNPARSVATSLQPIPPITVSALADLAPAISRLFYLDVDLTPPLQQLLGYNFRLHAD